MRVDHAPLAAGMSVGFVGSTRGRRSTPPLIAIAAPWTALTLVAAGGCRPDPAPERVGADRPRAEPTDGPGDGRARTGTSAHARALADASDTATAAAAAPDLPDELRFDAVEITRSMEADLHRAVGSDAEALAQVVKRVVVWWLDPRRDLRRGDRLDVVWSPAPAEDQEPRAHAVWLKSEKLGATRVAVLHPLERDPFPRWVDPVEGRWIERRLRPSPVERYEQITSLVNDGRRHRGVDFKAPEGTPVHATFAGRVTRVNWARRVNGRCIEITREGGRERALYLHLSRVAPEVRTGRRVERGQKIGEVGNTGRSFAPHLHYQLERDGRAVDPFRRHDSEVVPLTEDEVAAARARLAALSRARRRIAP